MANIQPTADNLILEALEEQTTASGIIIPDTANKEKPQKGKVIAVGPGRMEKGERVPMEVKEGDTVLFSTYAPSEIKVDGKDLLVLKEDSVLAILN